MISCHEYDYIEIACMYHYPVKLTLSNGSEVTGIALDTARNDTKQECLKIEVNGVQALIILNQVSKLTALIDNPYFTVVNFS